MPYGVVTFAGRKSSDYGIHVELLPDYQAAEREYELIPVPGRNGDVLIDKGSYKNVDRSYQVSAGEFNGNFVKLANRISQWVHGKSGYFELEDTYEPDYYRMACYHSQLDIANILGQAARAAITFDCKPQRYLKSGKKRYDVTNGGYLVNPTDEIALPEIMVYGSGKGTITVNGVTVTITAITNQMILNSDARDAYSVDASKNLNYAIQLNAKREYPRLIPGNNRVSYTGGISKVVVVPRWWTL